LPIIDGFNGATSVGKLLGIGQSAVSRAVVRGEKISEDMNLVLEELIEKPDNF
jgi:hypothetical protein